MAKKAERVRMRILRAGICNSKGFTLFELTVVIFIISLVLALSLPFFTGIGEGRIKSDAKRVASIIRYLNDSAISAKDTFQIRFNFKDRALTYTTPEGEKSEGFNSLSGIELQSGGMVSEGEVIVFFTPAGSSESFIVHLGDDASRMTVELNNMSGKVKIRLKDEL